MASVVSNIIGVVDPYDWDVGPLGIGAMQPSLMTARIAAGIAWLATPPSSTAHLDLEENDVDIGSVIWYERWRDAYAPLGEASPTLAASALRAWVFLTTPHEFAAAPNPPARTDDSDIATSSMASTGGRRRLGVQAISYIAQLSIPCGGPLGNQTMQCGGDAGLITYTCPTVLLQPSCSYWDEKLNAWSGAGCKLVSVTAAGILCACDHLTDFSGRFKAVGTQQKGVFAGASKLGSLSVFSQYPTIFIIVGSILVSDY